MTTNRPLAESALGQHNIPSGNERTRLEIGRRRQQLRDDGFFSTNAQKQFIFIIQRLTCKIHLCDDAVSLRLCVEVDVGRTRPTIYPGRIRPRLNCLEMEPTLLVRRLRRET